MRQATRNNRQHNQRHQGRFQNSNRQPAIQKTFGDKCFNHYRWVENGYQIVHMEEEWAEGTIYLGKKRVPTYEKEEHWGRKESCRRCEHGGKMGDFDNSLTGLGWLIVSLGTAAIILVIIAAVKIFS